MIVFVVLSAMVFITVNSQETIDPTCEHIQQRSLEDLLNNPPAVTNPNQLLECLPRKLIRQFTEKGGPHVEITISCLENKNGALCSSNGKGYALIADTLSQLFQENNRCFNCRAHHPNVDFTVSLMQRRHPKLLQRGLQYLTLQN